MKSSDGVCEKRLHLVPTASASRFTFFLRIVCTEPAFLFLVGRHGQAFQFMFYNHPSPDVIGFGGFLYHCLCSLVSLFFFPT